MTSFLKIAERGLCGGGGGVCGCIWVCVCVGGSTGIPMSVAVDGL